MGQNAKIGRAYMGIGKAGSKSWANIFSVFVGKFPNKFDISLSRRDDKTGKWVKATDIRYEDGTVLSLKDRYVTFSFDEGYTIDGPGLEYEEEAGEVPASEFLDAKATPF